jgi:hypothetical protein
MPEYLYENPETGEIIEVNQSISEDHTYSEEGLEFNRIFTIPNMSVDADSDPFSAEQFRQKTKAMKGSMGDMWDYSKELSDKRKESHGGTDPIRQKAEKEYSKKRKGIKYKEKQ